MESSYKKKELLQNRTYCRKGCMQEGNTQTVTLCQHAPAAGLNPARGRISVAKGNSSAPGPREDNLHAKVCKKFDARVNAGGFFANFCLKR